MRFRVLRGFLSIVGMVAATSGTAERSAASEAEPLAHVTIDATISCPDVDVATAGAIVSLDDAVVSGREYYPNLIVDHPGGNRLRVSFDSPAGVSEMFFQPKDVKGAAVSACYFSGKLMTLPGVSKQLTISIKHSFAYLWDKTDFIAGSVAGGASVMTIDLPRSATCGSLWKRDPREDEPPQSEHYYSQLGWSPDTTRPALVVDDGGHVTVVALPPIVHTPLVDHAYIRRDVSTSDLARWKSLPQNSIVCESGDTRYGNASPAPRVHLQTVDIGAFIHCSENNEAYSREHPSVEVEDALQRGTFFYPPIRILNHTGSVIHLQIAVPPGAYRLGMRLPYVRGGLPCYSSMSFAVLSSTPRHLAFVICSCGNSGDPGGFVAVRLAARSTRVGIAMMPRTIRCGTNYPDGFVPGKEIDYAVADGGVYYATFNPYDSSMQPTLIFDGPGMTRMFVALPADTLGSQQLEALHVLDVSAQTFSKWLGADTRPRLVCG